MQKHCSQCISFIFHFLGHIEDKLMIDIITIIKNSTLISPTYLLRECHLNHQHCSFLQTSSQGTEITEKKTLTQEKFNLCLIVTLKTNHKGHYFPLMLWNRFRVPRVTDINFLLTNIYALSRERLGELINWSLKATTKNAFN